ncbi:S100P-binding protein-like isoform X9 [Epinephelus fuscoguttatus]|uniref:S100P-binding protein-like isoform X5 n=1 Tax=Epinephelus fuscoguttatus TaxID=293821 RepID=UPI0020D0103D|nr:S100P-binding protein-like isoform X5 [Epinephelus fuscoguttatus]XP_049453085.1 S100P-binding protein-like isoform X9 [Epinephelus fuscoguttatus]
MENTSLNLNTPLCPFFNQAQCRRLRESAPCEYQATGPGLDVCRFSVEDMDRKAHSTSNSVFNRLQPTRHLAPLSIYSRMISCEQKAAPHHQRRLSNPFINFKIEIVNNCAMKRKQEDSSPNDGYETPAKKVCSPKGLSPDLGCFMDFCSPPAGQDSMSSSVISIPKLLDETLEAMSEVKQSVSFQHEECASSTKPGVDKGTEPHSLKSEKVLLNLAPPFDCDVDDILCLNPLGQKNSSEGFSDNVESCKSPSSSTFPDNPVATLTMVHGQKLERGAGKVEDREEELKKETHQKVDDDKGYFSMSYSKDSKTEHLEGDVEEEWNIGPPILESSISQVTLGGEETTLDTSYETTLPLQVQVKSVVVVPNQLTSSSKTDAPPLPVQTAKPTKLSPDENRAATSAKTVSASSQRPVLFDSEKDWDREKQLYVHAVNRHLKEHQRAGEDVMTELQNLMNHVADQTPGTGRRWQHPSDITRRNYVRRFGNQIPKVTLQEWQAKNCANKRFAKVPKIFERSHV